jgi:Zn-dependent peptidase ImmA (M78 family)
VRVLFHELGHFLLHVPGSGPTARFYGLLPESRLEKEADVVALCAVLPLHAVRANSSAPEGIDPNLWGTRLEILMTYGL